jgi:hypothetical protein
MDDIKHVVPQQVQKRRVHHPRMDLAQILGINLGSARSLPQEAPEDGRLAGALLSENKQEVPVASVYGLTERRLGIAVP